MTELITGRETTSGLPRSYATDGTIYGAELDRTAYFDRMLCSFDRDRASKDDLKRIGFNRYSDVIEMTMPLFFVYCVARAHRELYRGKNGFMISRLLSREISEELNHRLGYAIACGVEEFESRDSIQMFFEITRPLESKLGLREQITLVLYSLRDVFIRNGWGWEPRMLRTIDSFRNENFRAERLGERPRIEYFPVYAQLHKLNNIK